MQTQITKILIFGEGCMMFLRHSPYRKPCSKYIYGILHPVYPPNNNIPHLTNIITIKTIFQSSFREEYE